MKFKVIRKKSPWIVATIIVWLTVAGIVGAVFVYIWSAVDGRQIEQVRQLRHQMDSLSNRGYQLQHKIDSLDRLGVADIDLEDTALTSADDTSQMLP
ncbi:MAG: hypothetical protein ACFB15_20125 [Cyclobacteriaceae bacterium]